MAQLLELKTDWEALEKDGLPKEKTNIAIVEASRYLVVVMTNAQSQYLSKEVLKSWADTHNGLRNLGTKYPQLRGLIAKAFNEALPAEMDSLTVLKSIEEAVKIGALIEWNYLGNHKWRQIGITTGEVNIHQNVVALGVHPFDFRKRDGKLRGTRHFMPADWYSKAQVELCQHLKEAAVKAKAAYDAAHVKKTNMAEALEKAGLVGTTETGVKETATAAPAEIPPAPQLPVVEPEPATIPQPTEEDTTKPTIRFAEDILTPTGKTDRKKPRKAKKGGRRHNTEEEED